MCVRIDIALLAALSYVSVACASMVDRGFVPDGAVAADGALLDRDGAAGPGGVAEGRRIGNLSPSETTQWCTWFHSLHNPYADRRATGPDSNGFRHYEEYMRCGTQPTSYYLPELTLDDCVANLTIHPCVATIGELNACINALLDSCRLTTACPNFHAQSGCSTTILHAAPYSGPYGPFEILVPVR